MLRDLRSQFQVCNMITTINYVVTKDVFLSILQGSKMTAKTNGGRDREEVQKMVLLH